MVRRAAGGTSGGFLLASLFYSEIMQVKSSAQGED